MTVISFDIPDGQEERLYDGLCTANGYQAQVQDPDNPGEIIDNPISKQEFAVGKIRDYAINTCAQVEAQVAAEAARQTAIDTAMSDFTMDS